jgi:hypothetical protein
MLFGLTPGLKLVMGEDYYDYYSVWVRDVRGNQPKEI